MGRPVQLHSPPGCCRRRGSKVGQDIGRRLQGTELRTERREKLQNREGVREAKKQRQKMRTLPKKKKRNPPSWEVNHCHGIERVQQILEATKVEAHQLRQTQADPVHAVPWEGQAPGSQRTPNSSIQSNNDSELGHGLRGVSSAQPPCVPGKLIQQSLAWVEGNDRDGIMPDLLRI